MSTIPKISSRDNLDQTKTKNDLTKVNINSTDTEVKTEIQGKNIQNSSYVNSLTKGLSDHFSAFSSSTVRLHPSNIRDRFKTSEEEAKPVEKETFSNNAENQASEKSEGEEKTNEAKEQQSFSSSFMQGLQERGAVFAKVAGDYHPSKFFGKSDVKPDANENRPWTPNTIERALNRPEVLEYVDKKSVVANPEQREGAESPMTAKILDLLSSQTGQQIIENIIGNRSPVMTSKESVENTVKDVLGSHEGRGLVKDIVEEYVTEELTKNDEGIFGSLFSLDEVASTEGNEKGNAPTPINEDETT